MISLKRRQNVENGVLRSHATQELVYLFGNYSNYCYTLCVCVIPTWQLGSWIGCVLQMRTLIITIRMLTIDCLSIMDNNKLNHYIN